MKLIHFLFLVTLCFSCKEAHNESAKQESVIIMSTVSDINLSSGTLERVENFPTKYITPRSVDVWLPDAYSKDKKYAVLYMHDGQMLFDASTTWNKQEWKVDEVASKLIKEGKVQDFIVVSPWNIAEIRWQDYFPQKAFGYLNGETRNSLLAKAKAMN